jgi:hypothetical protein
LSTKSPHQSPLNLVFNTFLNSSKSLSNENNIKTDEIEHINMLGFITQESPKRNDENKKSELLIDIISPKISEDMYDSKSTIANGNISNKEPQKKTPDKKTENQFLINQQIYDIFEVNLFEN